MIVVARDNLLLYSTSDSGLHSPRRGRANFRMASTGMQAAEAHVLPQAEHRLIVAAAGIFYECCQPSVDLEHISF